MKMITATEANRDFSRLLDRVAEGEAIGITKHGRMIATLNPVRHKDDQAARQGVREHLEMLRRQPVMGIDRGTRDELYDDE
jgi:prevent-host-death family protein